MKRLFLTPSVAVMLLLGMAAAPAAQADVESTVVHTCSILVYHQEYEPPVDVTRDRTRLHSEGAFGPCIGTRYPGLTGGTFLLDAVGELDCITGGNSEGTMRFDFSNGKLAVVHYPLIALSLRPTGFAVVFTTGEVTGGNAFPHGTLVALPSLQINLTPQDCLSGEGIESVTAIAVAVTFLHP